MPDQNNDMPKIGALTDADQIIALPVGAIVTDRDGDTYAQATDRTWVRSDDYVISNASHIAGIRGYFHNLFTPYTLTSLPEQPDLYQQARIALRDRTGTEPDIEHVHQVSRIMQDQDLTPGAAVSAWQIANAESIAAPAAVEVDVHDANFGVVVFVKDNDVAGLARLRAHAALDALLDQHGVTR